MFHITWPLRNFILLTFGKLGGLFWASMFLAKVSNVSRLHYAPFSSLSCKKSWDLAPSRNAVKDPLPTILKRWPYVITNVCACNVCAHAYVCVTVCLCVCVCGGVYPGNWALTVSVHHPLMLHAAIPAWGCTHNLGTTRSPTMRKLVKYNLPQSLGKLSK